MDKEKVEAIQQAVRENKRLNEEEILQFSTEKFPADLLQKFDSNTLAVIFSYMNEAAQTRIFAALTPDGQIQLVKALSKLPNFSSSEFVSIMKATLQNVIAAMEKSHVPSWDTAMTANLLKRLDQESEDKFLNALGQKEPELSEAIKENQFFFEDIVMLDDKYLQKLLNAVEQGEIVRALKAVDAEVQEKCFANMTEQQASIVKEEMEFIGGVSLLDVEMSQKRIMSEMRKLKDTREIVFPRGIAGEYVQ
ncbi:MAG: FliG C-terminal domain-containing protein [Spirochaetota bacterium]